MANAQYLNDGSIGILCNGAQGRAGIQLRTDLPADNHNGSIIIMWEAHNDCKTGFEKSIEAAKR